MGKAFAIWGASIGIGLAVGPIAGGIITQFFGWRPIFLINVPICLGLLYATWRNIRESRRPEAQNIDVPGLVSFSLALALLAHCSYPALTPAGSIPFFSSSWLVPPCSAPRSSGSSAATPKP
jgi:MFS family permease